MDTTDLLPIKFDCWTRQGTSHPLTPTSLPTPVTFRIPYTFSPQSLEVTRNLSGPPEPFCV